MFSLILFLNISSYIWGSFSFEYVFIYEFYVYGCFICMYFCTPEEGIGSHGTTLIDGYELPCGCQELDSGPLEEQPVLLNTESSLWPRDLCSLLFWGSVVNRKPSVVSNLGFLSIFQYLMGKSFSPPCASSFLIYKTELPAITY